MSLPLYVLNLEASADRLARLRTHLATRGLDFVRIEAHDGRLAPPTAHPDYDDAAMRAVMGRPLLGGELGCIVSHRRALQAFVDGGAPWAVVLEDDVELVPAFATLVPAIAGWLQAHRPGWRVANLGHPVVKYATELQRFAADGVEHRLLAAHYYPMGAFCLLWSRRAAIELLAQGPAIRLPWDNGLQNWLCRAGGGFALSPPLARVLDVRSDIDASRPHESSQRARDVRERLAGVKKQRRLWANRVQAWRHLLAERRHGPPG